MYRYFMSCVGFLSRSQGQERMRTMGESRKYSYHDHKKHLGIPRAGGVLWTGISVGIGGVKTWNSKRKGNDQFWISRAEKQVENADLLPFILCIKHELWTVDKDQSHNYIFTFMRSNLRCEVCTIGHTNY